jgi:hypothetical protein
MANPEHLAKLKEGVKAWNRWRKEKPLVDVDLSEANLAGLDFTGVDFSIRLDIDPDVVGNLESRNIHFDLISSSVDLAAANLRAAILAGAEFRGCSLVKANLWGAALDESNLISTDLTKADMRLATLNQSNLRASILKEANLTEARFEGTSLDDLDLSDVIGLDKAVHFGPSSIGIDTIYKSKGKIPHVFLRGAGVPENFIEYMASLVGTGIEFYSLFISYSTHDQEFAERLHADLQAKGVRCWFAPHDLRGGKKVHKQIDEAIRVYDKLLLILSKASMASEWVRTEIAIARTREVEQKREVLFPISLCPFKTIRNWEYFDSDIGKDSAREIREFHIPDFSNWKDHDSYKLAFDRLLDDLHGKPEPLSA